MSEFSLFHNDAYQFSMLYAHWKNNGRHDKECTAEAYYRRPSHPGDSTMPVMACAYRINEMLNSDGFKEPFSHEDMPFIQNHLLKLSDDDFAPFEEYLMTQLPMELAALTVRYPRDGEALVPNYPVVQVTGPLGAVHLVETPILSMLNTGVRAAIVARRLRRLVGPSIKLLDFATRREDSEQAVHTAVAAAIGGFDGTSNTEAGRLYEIPVSGTMAHAYVLSYGMTGELQSFKDFIRVFPQNHVLLVDTYDIMKGVANAIRAALEMGHPLNAIRIDSPGRGWAITLRDVRALLNLMGCKGTKIAVSGDYNEDLILELKKAGDALSLIDVIGIGSYLAAPGFSAGFVYKLVEIEGEPVMKMSGDKSSRPCHKVWWRSQDKKNLLCRAGLGPVGSFVNPPMVSVLQLDRGPGFFGSDYFSQARSLTPVSASASDSQWDDSDISTVAASLAP